MPHRFRKALTSNKSKRIMWLEYVRQGGHVSAKIRGSLSNNGTTWDIFKTIQRAQGTSKHWRWRQNVGDVNDNNDAEPPQQCPLHLLTLTLTSLPPITLLQLNNTHSSTPLDHNACHPFYHNSCMMFYSWHSTTTNILCSEKIFPMRCRHTHLLLQPCQRSQFILWMNTLSNNSRRRLFVLFFY